MRYNPESSICLLKSCYLKHDDLLLLLIEEISFIVAAVVAVGWLFVRGIFECVRSRTGGGGVGGKDVDER